MKSENLFTIFRIKKNVTPEQSKTVFREDEAATQTKIAELQAQNEKIEKVSPFVETGAYNLVVDLSDDLEDYEGPKTVGFVASKIADAFKKALEEPESVLVISGRSKRVRTKVDISNSDNLLPLMEKLRKEMKLQKIIILCLNADIILRPNMGKVLSLCSESNATISLQLCLSHEYNLPSEWQSIESDS